MTNPSFKHIDEQKPTKDWRNGLFWYVMALLSFGAGVGIVLWLNG